MEKIAIKDMSPEQFKDYCENHYDPGSPRFNDLLARQRAELGIEGGSKIEVEVAKPEKSNKKVHFSPDVKVASVEEISTPRYIEPPVPKSVDSNESNSCLGMQEPNPANFLKNNMLTQSYSQLPTFENSALPDAQNGKNSSFLQYFSNKKTLIIGSILLLELVDFGWTYKRIASTHEWQTADLKKRVLLLLKNSQQARLLARLKG